MTELGKCLAFHFKYHAEMRHLYWQREEADDDGAPFGFDAKTLEMVNAVGLQCRQEAAIFLGECGKLINDQFESMGKCSKPDVSERKWTVSCGVWRQGVGTPPNKNWKMKVGVKLPKDGNEILVWLWGTNKKKNTDPVDVMVKQLCGVAQASPKELGTGGGGGAVVLDRIPVLSPSQTGFEIDREKVLQHVKNTLEKVTPGNFDNMYRLIWN